MSYSGSLHRPLGVVAAALLFTLASCAGSTSEGGPGDGSDASPTDSSSPTDVSSSDTTPLDVMTDSDPPHETDGADGPDGTDILSPDAEDGGSVDAPDDGATEDAPSDVTLSDSGSPDDVTVEDAGSGSDGVEDMEQVDASETTEDVEGPCTADEDCEPQNSCWVATCDVESGTCSESQLDEGVSCDDGNACSSGDSCTAQGWCLGLQAVSCSDDNPCTDDTCSPAIGCDFKNNFAACDDGDLCTVGEQCGGGVCTGGASLCTDGNPCTTDLCDGETGACDFPPDDDAPCDDGSACTGGDACITGVCTPGPMDACDDSNPCTSDLCQEGACSNTVLDGAACDDADACTEGDVCIQDTCNSGAPVDCDDGNECTDTVCDAVNGCTATVLEGTPCEDGNACSTESACNAAAQCATTVELICDDENECTEDSCDSASGCFFTSTLVACDDGDICTTQDTCQADGSCVGAQDDCDDQNACTQDTCDAVTGCAHEDTAAACDLGNPCMVYGCNTQTGCTEVPNSDACDDSDLCTGPDLCTDGACGGQEILCDDDDPCTADSCDPVEGCQHVAQDIDCDDGDPCTENEVCEQTDPFCNGGTPVAQDDGVECTVDACSVDGGVTHTPDASACAIGEACDPEAGCVVGTPVLVISKHSLATGALVDSGQGQWIAVTNVGNAFMDLTELYLLTKTSDMALIESTSGVVTDPVLVGPGETIAGLKEPTAEAPIASEPFDFFFASAQDPNFHWDPASDEVRLVDGGFNTVDSVVVYGVLEGPFTSTNQCPVFQGYATELDTVALAEATSQNGNNDARQWCVYDETGGAPASEAPDCNRARINEIGLAEPDGERFVELNLPFGGHTGDLKIRFLDSQGNAVKTLLISDTRMPVGENLVYTDGVAGITLPGLTDGAVALLRGDDLLDIYGFGDLVAEVDGVVGHPMVEGSAGPAQTQGMSAARVFDGVDSQDNGADFAHGAPSPGLLNAIW